MRSVNRDDPLADWLDVGRSVSLCDGNGVAMNPCVCRRRVVIDIHFLRDDDRVQRLLLSLIPGVVLARIVTPVEREDGNLAAVPLAVERVSVAVDGRNVDLAIRGLR